MNSDASTGPTSSDGGYDASVTPSTALLNQRLGTSPAPRTLTPSEVDLLRSSKEEIGKAVVAALAEDEQTMQLIQALERSLDDRIEHERLVTTLSQRPRFTAFQAVELKDLAHLAEPDILYDPAVRRCWQRLLSRIEGDVNNASERAPGFEGAPDRLPRAEMQSACEELRELLGQ